MKHKIDKNLHLPTGTYHFEIKSTKIIKARFGRYGAQLLLVPIRYEHSAVLFHHIWFGNYKDFKDTHMNKSVKVWRVAKARANEIKIKISDLLKNKEINQTIIAEVTYYPNYMNFGPQSIITKIIA